ncbi:MAG: hypothetical protein AB7R33_03895 [Thermoleophilia bacterium]
MTTIYYAVQNGRMAKEMETARRQSVAPRLVLDLELVGSYVFAVVRNVGQGPAVAGRFRLNFVGPDSTQSFAVEWETHALAPGSQRIFGPKPAGEDLFDAEALLVRANAIVLEGRFHDTFGDERHVADRMEDLAARIKAHRQVETLIRESDGDKNRKELRKLTRQIELLRGGVDRVAGALSNESTTNVGEARSGREDAR